MKSVKPTGDTSTTGEIGVDVGEQSLFVCLRHTTRGGSSAG
ncbi:MAG: hypothetical protein QM715_13010 [Nibricoccus sp.]